MKTWAIEGELQQKVRTALANSIWFRNLEEQQIEQVIGLARLCSYEQGETVVRQGDPSDAFYILLRGDITIEVDHGGGDAVEVGRVRPPFTFGEIGLLLGQPRSASIVAAGEVYVLGFERAVFEQMFHEIPNFRLSVARGLAQRLEQVSEMVIPEHEDAEIAPKADVVAMLPWTFIERHRVLPIEVAGNVLKTGFVDDPTPKVLAAVRQLLPSMELEPVRISRPMFERFLASRSGLEEWQEQREGEPSAVSSVEPPARLKSLLERMVAEGASDLHLLPSRQPTWRIDGDIQTIEDATPVGENEVYELLRPVMEQRHLDEFEGERDVDLGYTMEGLGRFRINMYRSYRGIGAAFRIIPSQILSIEQLGLPSVVKTLCLQPKGLVVVTGPTGSGKSTSLASMIDFINRTKKVHIVTLEDPIEFVHSDQLSMINQREIGGHAVSFARGLRAALREDPDIVLVGEMRDRETAALALEVANTGHLVFTTLHTNSAVSTVERIVEMFPSEVQAQVRAALADVLRAVVSQTLCKRRGGGRVAALEVLVGSAAVANVIREGKTAQLQNLMQSGGKEGNILLNQYLAHLVKDRKVLRDEALSKAVDKKDLTLRLSKLMAPPTTGKG